MSTEWRINLFGITRNSRRIGVRHIITENLYYIMLITPKNLQLFPSVRFTKTNS